MHFINSAHYSHTTISWVKKCMYICLLSCLVLAIAPTPKLVLYFSPVMPKMQCISDDDEVEVVDNANSQLLHYANISIIPIYFQRKGKRRPPAIWHCSQQTQCIASARVVKIFYLKNTHQHTSTQCVLQVASKKV